MSMRKGKLKLLWNSSLELFSKEHKTVVTLENKIMHLRELRLPSPTFPGLMAYMFFTEDKLKTYKVPWVIHDQKANMNIPGLSYNRKRAPLTFVCHI